MQTGGGCGLAELGCVDLGLCNGLGKLRFLLLAPLPFLLHPVPHAPPLRLLTHSKILDWTFYLGLALLINQPASLDEGGGGKGIFGILA